MEVLRTIYRWYGRDHIRVLALLAVISNVLILAPSLHMMQVYNRVLASYSIETLIYITLICVFALAIYGVAEATRGRVAQRLATSYSLAVSDRLFASFAASATSSNSSAQNIRDFQAVRGFLASRSFVALFDLPFVPFYLLILCIVHWTVGLLTLAGACVLAVLGYMNSKANDQEQKISRKAEAEAAAVAQSALAHSTDVRSLGLLSNLQGWWLRKMDAALAASDNVARQSSSYYGMSRGVRQCLQVMLMAWSAFLVIHGDMSAGLVFLASVVSGKALAPIEQMIGAWDQLVKARTAFLSLEEALDHHDATTERPRLPEPKGHLSIENLVVLGGTARKSGKPIIDDVSFEVHPGQLIAIVGLSGSGKSVLARAIAGAMDIDSGVIRLDNAAREQWPDAQWGRALGYVNQEIGLLPGTVAANIARFEAGVSANDIYAAAQRAGVHDVLLSLDDGYTTAISDGAVNLSSGQRKAIALARAFYGNPKVLILDQPTTHLDQMMEQRLIASLAQAKASGMSIIVISQRGAIMELADRVYVMRDGRLHAMNEKAAAASTAKPQMATQISDRQTSPAQGTGPGPKPTVYFEPKPAPAATPAQRGGRLKGPAAAAAPGRPS